MILFKESLNIDCQQMTLEIQVMAWDRDKKVVGLNRLMGSQPPPPTPFLIIGSPKAILI
jgi:hypothetical protein